MAAVFWPLSPVSIKYPFGTRSASKTRLRERFNWPDCQKKADSGLFLKGARYGLRLDPEKVNLGSIWARISVARIKRIRIVNPLHPMREESHRPRRGTPTADQGEILDTLLPRRAPPCPGGALRRGGIAGFSSWIFVTDRNQRVFCSYDLSRVMKEP
jgi:hypothetical protein